MNSDPTARRQSLTAAPNRLLAHIVFTDGLTRAYVLGLAVTALCGQQFVPTRDPRGYPICEQCVHIHDLVMTARTAAQALADQQ